MRPEKGRIHRRLKTMWNVILSIVKNACRYFSSSNCGIVPENVRTIFRLIDILRAYFFIFQNVFIFFFCILFLNVCLWLRMRKWKSSLLYFGFTFVSHENVMSLKTERKNCMWVFCVWNCVCSKTRIWQQRNEGKWERTILHISRHLKSSVHLRKPFFGFFFKYVNVFFSLFV